MAGSLRSILFFAALASPAAAGAADFHFLGTKAFPDQTGKLFDIPEGAPVQVASPGANPATVTYADPLRKDADGKPFVHTFQVPRAELTDYFDSETDAFRVFFQQGWDAMDSFSNPKVSCPQEDGAKCGLQQNRGSVDKGTLTGLLMSCAPDRWPAGASPVISRCERVPIDAYKAACKNRKNTPLAQGLAAATAPGTPACTANQWLAPIDYPACKPPEEKIIRDNSDQKLAFYRRTCPYEPGQRIPPMSGVKLTVPEPNCMILKSAQHPYTKIVLHHSEGSPMASPAPLYCDYSSEGYNDVPYHFYIFQDGEGRWKVAQGRPLTAQGADVDAGLDDDEIGVAIAGDYRPGGPTPDHPFAKTALPTAEAVQELQSLVENLKAQFPTITNIQGHGEAKAEGNHCNKDCPGPGGMYLVRLLRLKFFPPAAAVTR